MDPLSAGIMGGAMLLTGGMSAAGQSEANEMNYKIAKEQMKFQERMSNTAHQREVEDLRKAGLNPLLSVSKGGASSPSGASATMGNVGDAFSRHIDASKLLALEQSRAAIDHTEAQVKVLQDQAENMSKQNELLKMTIDWYKDHPGSAPNIPGQAASNSVKSWVDAAYDFGGKIGEK